MMDVASLRSELEQHLKSNPHEQAPEGFRDRFDHWAEIYEAETDEEVKGKLAALLRKVRDEAEAAAKAGMADRAEPADLPGGAAGSSGAQDEPMPPAASRAGGGSALILVAIALALAAAAYFYFRS